jgi:hypothetical protein
MAANGRDPIPVPAVLIEPGELRPLARVLLVGRDRVEALGIGAKWMPESSNMAAQDEIERLHLLGAGFTGIEVLQGAAEPRGWARRRLDGVAARWR